MSQTLEIAEGKRMSFLQLIQETAIEIPIIQRDYAQGRDDEKDVRNTFLDALLNYLLNDAKADLDFIYGSIINGNLTPLDGQQRLTTLFLLHWYLAIKDGEYENFWLLLLGDNNEVKFTYKTRVSSQEFCHQLVNHPVDLKNLESSDRWKINTISNTIRNQSWYYSAWNNDPTISGILTMLDAIHDKFNPHQLPLYSRLTGDHSAITFLFLDMEKSQLPEELYIKMNARGKPLTPFENFKAKLEKHIKSSHFNLKSEYKTPFGDTEKDATVQEYFSYKIDNDWSNLFWDLTGGKSFDGKLLNFIRIVVTNSYSCKIDEQTFRNGIKLLLGKDGDEDEDSQKGTKDISFTDYQSINSLDENAIADLIGFFDLISASVPLKLYLDSTDYINEDSLIRSVIEGNIKYETRVLFYGLYKHILKSGLNSGELKEWVRVLFNIATNTIFNKANEYSSGLIGINKIIETQRGILDLLLSDWHFTGFNSQQIEEEKIKAHLISKNSAWRSLVVEAESHGYFKGQIGFILEFSGIRKYYSLNKSCNWTDAEDTTFSASFKEYYEKSNAVFGDKGLRTFKDHTWERALLCKGDYLLRKGRNYSFLIRSDRDISWKRLLRGSFDTIDSFYHKRSFYIKDLLDSISVDQIAADLLAIIDSELTQPSIFDWRSLFIKYSKTINACNMRFVRFNEVDEYPILLLEKSSTNGKHRELYSYALKCELENLGNTVVYKEQSSREQPKFIQKVNNADVRISCEIRNNDWQFKIENRGDVEYCETIDAVVKVLSNNGILINSTNPA